jgi:hypothetical protein
VEAAGDFPYAASELWCDLGYSFGDAGKGLLGHRQHGLGDHREEFRCRHPNQRQEVFGGFLFRLGLGGQFAQMLHHGVRVDLPDGADLVFELALTLEFAFTLEFALELTLTFQLALAQ